MSERLKSLVADLALMSASVAVALIICEMVVFGHILKPDDLLENVTINRVVRYEPDTRAVFRHPDGSETLVTINAQGWNSTKPSYQLARTPGVMRVAVIGDSYVHGKFVDVEEGFPEVIEAELAKAGVANEVYRFGMDGAPLSQYLHVLRHEVRKYKPDVVVVPLIHNDFDESYRFLKTRYSSSFLKIGTDEAGLPVEIEPVPFTPSLADQMRQFATFRYLYYETGLYLTAKSLVSQLFWGGNEDFDPRFVQSAVDIRKIADHEKNRFFAHYIMSEMKKIAEADGFELLFVMDGVREAVYAGKPASDYEVGKLNEIAAQVTAALGLRFRDLGSAFAADYAVHGQRLEYPYDWHWNVRGNALVGREIAGMILERRTNLSAVIESRSGEASGG